MNRREGIATGVVAAFLLVAGATWLSLHDPSRSDFKAGTQNHTLLAVAPQSGSVPATQRSPNSATQPEIPSILGRALLKRYADATGGDLNDYTVADLVFNLRDESLPKKVRLRVAAELARRGTDEALAALKELVGNTAFPLRAAIAESLGYCPHASARELLLSLLKDADEAVVRGAIRGLAIQGGAEAMAVLQQAFAETRDRGVQQEILVGLVKQPWVMAQPFFKGILASADSDSALRIAAVEALASGNEETAPMLLQAADDSNPDVRAAAAWALAMHGSTGGMGAELAGRLERELDANVRSGLYQALLSQSDYDFNTVLPVVLGEQDLETRLSGLGLWAAAAKNDRTGMTAQEFDSRAVPELKEWALTAEQPNERLSAVIALRRSKTAGAQVALQEIVVSASDLKVVNAAQAALAGVRK